MGRDADQGLINVRWAHALIDGLAAAGVRHAYAAPGSRSTPLVLAASRHPLISLRMHFDERGTAFMALGSARATGIPALWITTSGTAVANGYPAVVEASVDAVPMLLLTADRPTELRGTGANQTIDQVEIFGRYPRWFVDVAPPDTSATDEDARRLASDSVRRSLETTPGPVHLNCMFREPLAPADSLPSLDIDATRAEVDASPLRRKRSDLSDVASRLLVARRGLVVVGRTNDPEIGRTALMLTRRLGWTALMDGASGGRPAANEGIIHYDAILASTLSPEQKPDLVLHIGARGTSKRLHQYLEASGADVIMLRQDERPFSLGVEETVVHGRPVELLEALGDGTPEADADWADEWRATDQRVGEWLEGAEFLQTLNEPSVARLVAERVAAEDSLVLASSMPVRDVETFARAGTPRGRVFVNRGASGIDGTIATAVGIADTTERSVTVLIGDLALLHDLNSLAAIRDAAAPVRIVVVNNDGGGIFSMLPIRKHEQDFEPLFGTPHGLGFGDAAAMFGLDYLQPESLEELDDVLSVSVRNELVEVRTNREENAALHREIFAAMRRDLTQESVR
jgi:2-succinyl-5-enolpyruvyl-6-hydroxy-3-cyclohexene-1-carboxylate synthase